jgi:transglutaminase-like putative cysteine protease
MSKKSPRLWDRLSILLLLVCIWLPAAVLRSTGWAPDLDQVELLALIGVGLGLLVGRSKLSTVKAHGIFFVLTLIIPVWLFTARMTPANPWWTRLSLLAYRVNLAFAQVINGRLVQDSIIFIIFCSYFFWIIGYFTGYGFSRKWNPWQGLLAAAGIFGVIDFYAGEHIGTKWVGAILAFCLLLLAARLFWVYQKSVWKENGYFIERDAGETVFRVAGITAVILVLLSWNLQTIILSFTPGTPEHEKVSEFWKNIQSGMQNNFAALQSSTSLTGSYPGGMKLGDQAPIRQNPAFQVKILSTSGEIPRFYWRVRIYDEYKNGQWQAPEISNLNGPIMSAEQMDASPMFSRAKVQYIWQEGDGSIIPFTGRLGGLDIPYNFELYKDNGQVSGDGILFPGKPLAKDSLFILDSAVFSGSQDDLRSIAYSFPGEVGARYLQVPSTVPPRVIDLAKQIAVGDTVFERVQSVTEFLRNGYIYKSQISPIPAGRDPIDWFLFESKQGFCNYYASAEVILLRAAGIPARLAVGYSQGDATSDGFQIRLVNGHAWPEVYFPGAGWVPFEPTSSEADLPYSIGTTDNQNNPRDELSPEERRGQGLGNTGLQPNPGEETEGIATSPAKWIIPVILLVIATLCGVGIWLVAKKKAWKKPPRLSLIILRWLTAHHLHIPSWLAWWDWYTGLSDLARQYFWLEKLAVFSGLVSKLSGTPAELIIELTDAMPDQLPAARQFLDGLYMELYSREKDYPANECKAAGAALQKGLIKAIRERLFHISMK